jgi:flagellar hook-basal body complex protein FliE
MTPIRLDIDRVDTPQSTPTRTEDPSGSFGDKLTAAIGDLEEVAATADGSAGSAEGLVAGEVGIHEAMVAMEKADIALRMGTTVRNKLLEAYRTLSQIG